jgi:hypothetical protein
VLRELRQRRPASAFAIVASLGAAALGYARARLARTTIPSTSESPLIASAPATSIPGADNHA